MLGHMACVEFQSRKALLGGFACGLYVATRRGLSIGVGRGGRGLQNKVPFCSLVNQEGLAKLAGVLRFTLSIWFYSVF